MKNIHVRSNGVYKLLTGLNVHKAARPDAVPTIFLHDFALELAPIMTKLFKLSLDIGSARRLERSINCSHFKKREWHLASSYRPVSLPSISCKLLEHIVHSQIMVHYDGNIIQTDRQHGFRQRRSCELQLLITVDKVAKSKALGDQVNIVLIFTRPLTKCHINNFYTNSTFMASEETLGTGKRTSWQNGRSKSP